MNKVFLALALVCTGCSSGYPVIGIGWVKSEAGVTKLDLIGAKVTRTGITAGVVSETAVSIPPSQTNVVEMTTSFFGKTKITVK